MFPGSYENAFAKQLSAYPSAMERELMRQQEVYSSPSARLLEQMVDGEKMLQHLLGSGVYPAIHALEADLRRSAAFDALVSAPSILAKEVARLSALHQAETDWARSLSANLEFTRFSELAAGLRSITDFGELIPQLEFTLGTAALEFPGVFAPLDDRLAEIARDIAGGVGRAVEGSEGEDTTVASFLTELLSHYGLVDTNGEPRIRLIIAVVLLSLTGAGAGESLGGEWNRWRDAPDHPKEAAYRASHQKKLDQLLDALQNPPRAARVVRRAWLREEPNASSAKLGAVMEPGAFLVVRERRDGWLLVDAEPVPGEVRRGWVYGKLARYD